MRGQVAQSVERFSEKEEVVGAEPTLTTDCDRPIQGCLLRLGPRFDLALGIDSRETVFVAVSTGVGTALCCLAEMYCACTGVTYGQIAQHCDL